MSKLTLAERARRSIVSRVNALRIRRFYKRVQKNCSERLLQWHAPLNEFTDGGGFRSPMRDLKLHHLDCLLQVAAPKSIVELGSGSTSPVFCTYANSCDAHYLSLDESEKWLENTRNLCAKHTGLHGDINFTSSPRSVDTTESSSRIRYAFEYLRYYEFVFIDGPSFMVEGKRCPGVNTDIVEIMQWGRPRVIAVDLRKETVEFIQAQFGEHYTLEESSFLNTHSKWVRPPLNYLSVFTLKKTSAGFAEGF